MYNFYKGTKNIPFEFTVKEKGQVVTLEGATVNIDIFIDGRKTETKIANITDPINGVTTISLDFDRSGRYEFQAWVTFSNGSVIPSDKDKIFVKE